MIDPFDTLGLPARYALDLKAAEQRHRELSKALHPDRFAGSPAAERRMALSRAIDVNEAWRAMRDPVKRAEALFRKRGVELTETNEPKPPPSLLMEMMDAREELSEARAAKDGARATKLGEAMRAREASVIEKLATEFDAAGSELEKLRNLLPSLGELRYVRRFLDEVSAIEEELAS